MSYIDHIETWITIGGWFVFGITILICVAIVLDWWTNGK